MQDMTQDMTQTDRARELWRVWAARRGEIVAALPDQIVGARTPSAWMTSAWRVVSDPALAGATPDALVDALRQAASDGLMPHEGALHPQADGSVAWVPRWAAWRSLLHRCMPDLYVRSDVVRTTNDFTVRFDERGAIAYLNYYRDPDAGDTPWSAAFAAASHGQLSLRNRYVLLDRADAERQAAAHLRLPAPEDAESLAQRVVLVRMAQLLPLELDWLPVRRFWGVARRFWVEA